MKKGIDLREGMAIGLSFAVKSSAAGNTIEVEALDAPCLSKQCYC